LIEVSSAPPQIAVSDHEARRSALWVTEIPVTQGPLASNDPDRPANARLALPDVELRHLAALVTVAHERSMRAAARRLGCSQSTVSQRLLEIERAAGARLVSRERVRREARLTDAGRSLLFHAEAVLDRVEAARADLATLGREDQLRLGVYQGAPLRLLPAILQRLGGLQVTPCEGRNDLELLSAVRSGTLDLTFAALPLPAGPFDYLRLLDEADGPPVLESGEAGGALRLEELLQLNTTVLAWHRYRQLPSGAARFREASAEVFARATGADRGS
jgi:molybdenum-dependent DNA-binding transcriptional regulator ModE